MQRWRKNVHKECKKSNIFCEFSGKDEKNPSGITGCKKKN